MLLFLAALAALGQIPTWLQVIAVLLAGTATLQKLGGGAVPGDIGIDTNLSADGCSGAHRPQAKR